MTDPGPTGMLFAAWEDCDRVLAGITPAEAVTRYFGGSSFAWTLAHLSNTLDNGVNVRFAGRQPNPLLTREQFRMGGSGEAEDWEAIQQAVVEVRAAVQDYLGEIGEGDLDRVIPYTGVFAAMRETGITLRHGLARVVAHHYFHIGEIATKHSMLGHQIGDYPGLMLQAR